MLPPSQELSMLPPLCSLSNTEEIRVVGDRLREDALIIPEREVALLISKAEKYGASIMRS